jgi:hypothetical protein
MSAHRWKTAGYAMAGPYADEEEEKPLDPNIEKVRRKLIRFMGINLGLLFIAVMVVVAALVYKSRSAVAPKQPASELPVPSGAPLAGDIVLPVGARVVSQSLSGNRVSIDAELADGSRTIFVYDIAENRMIGQFAIRNR